MKAVWYERNGPADVMQIGEEPIPSPAPGEVLVKIISSGINPSDWKRRAGQTRGMEFPRVIPHQDGSGVIEAVGDGVPGSRIGERVWLYEAQYGRPFGTAAEYCSIPSNHAIAMPQGVSFQQGACLGVPAMTAHRCVFADGSVTGKTVLVTGGAGAVGNYAVQLAALDGAAVISTVSSDHKAGIARDAGAAHTINYRAEDTAQRIMELTGGEGVDHIVEVDFAGNFSVSREVIRSNGVIAIYAQGTVAAPPVPLQIRSSNVTVRSVLVYDMPEQAKQDASDQITTLLEQDKLTHLLGPRFPLESIVEAHQAVEAGAIGNVTLDVAIAG